MAISTYMTFLMHGNAKLCDIEDFPDLGGEPEMIDVTTLSDKMKKYIAGIQDTSALKFTANYTDTDYEAVEALAGLSEGYSVWFGGTESAGVVTPTGSAGKFDFTGELSVYVKGGGVNEAVKMIITIAPSTVITHT